jgi:hypothetical protein
MVSTDPRAPHGYDSNGNPNAPYGLKRDGTPRLSNRGAQPGQMGNGNATRAKATKGPQLSGNPTVDQVKGMLCELADNVLVMPLVALSAVPTVQARLGKHAQALAGDAALIHHLAPSIADGLIMGAQTRPGLLSWMDGAVKNAPYILLAQSGFALAKAVTTNHIHPDPKLALIGGQIMEMRISQMADAMADEMPIPAEAA